MIHTIFMVMTSHSLFILWLCSLSPFPSTRKSYFPWHSTELNLVFNIIFDVYLTVTHPPSLSLKNLAVPIITHDSSVIINFPILFLPSLTIGHSWHPFLPINLCSFENHQKFSFRVTLHGAMFTLNLLIVTSSLIDSLPHHMWHVFTKNDDDGGNC